MGFIDAYIEHTKDFESPGSFWRWSAYTTIAAVLRDSIWKDDGDGKLYPHIYVLFLAGSGSRKGRPVGTSESLIKEIANTKIISGRASIQAIVNELSQAETDIVTGKLQKAGAAIFYAPELSAGIVSDPAAVAVLTDIYDGKANYTTNLVGRGKVGGGPVVFSMLAASNEAMLEDMYNRRSIEGGLLARTFLVTPNEFRPSNSLLIKIDRKASFENLVKELKPITELRGGVTFTTAAAFEYDSWYKSFRDGYRDKKDKSGIMGRMHTGVMKVMMILAANDYTTEITVKHTQQAINECLELLPNYQRFILGTNDTDNSKVGTRIIDILLSSRDNKISKREIMAQYWAEFDVVQLDTCTAALEMAGFVEISATSQGSFYRLTDKFLKRMKDGE